MTQQAELYKKIDTLPLKYFGQVYDFVGYLQNIAEKEAAAKEQRAAKERAAFIKYADELNAEAEDVLKYQVPLFEGEDEK